MPVAVAFDTLKFARRLKDSGVPDNQAEAFSEAFRDAQETQLEALATKGDVREIRLEMATKTDIAKLDRGIDAINGELRLIKWMLAVVIAVTVLPALKTLLSL